MALPAPTTPASYSVSGTVSGLAPGAQVTLANNGTDAVTVKAEGAFAFGAAVPANGSYSVTVDKQPVGQTCSLAGGTGAGSGVTANIDNVRIVCSTHTYGIGGTVTGLASGQQVTLLNNAGDAITIAADGGFSFPAPVAHNGSYAVTVGTQPVGQTCSLAGGSGAGSGVTAPVDNIRITCSTHTYSIGGTVAGLASGQQVTLLNNAGDPLTLQANGSFSFAAPVPYNGSYAVTIGTQPNGQTCSLAGGTGAGSGVVADVSNVRVICSVNTYTVGGTVTGLAGGQVTLFNNGGDALTLTSNGAFTFSTAVPYMGSYSVTVGTQPAGQTCSVSNGSGVGSAAIANITNVQVSCSASVYSIGGTVTGLASGQQVTLLNNGTDAFTTHADGSFRFAVPVAYMGSYSVTVSTQPGGQRCVVTHGSGSSVSAEIVGVGVACLASGHTSTWAGSGVHGNADGTGPSAQFYGPVRAAVDHAGNVYVADHYNHSIRKITPMGLVSTLAGSGAPGRADGLGSAASFDHPAGIAVDGDGNVYVADTKNNSIRKITPAGVVSTLAGAGTAGYADGPGLAALFDYPTGLALDGSRNLYVTDTFNHRIRKITPAGVVTTLAGSGIAGRADGPGSAASFSGPLGLAFDGSGNLYVVDRDNHSIRKITSAGVVSTLAGSETPGATNGTGSAASFHFPFDITADSSGNAYIADPRNNMIRKMTPAGVVTTLAGNGASGRADGIGAAASFAEPAGITIDGNGILYVADHGNNLIRKLVP
ncbi:hypothetical protein [Variovorax boronicumulans]